MEVENVSSLNQCLLVNFSREDLTVSSTYTFSDVYISVFERQHLADAVIFACSSERAEPSPDIVNSI